MRIDNPRLSGSIFTTNVFIESPDVKSYTIELESDQIYDIEEITSETVSGNLRGGFYILSSGEGGRFGTSITGLDPVLMYPTRSTSTATALNRVSAGDRVNFSVNDIVSPIDTSIKIRMKLV